MCRRSNDRPGPALALENISIDQFKANTEKTMPKTNIFRNAATAETAAFNIRNIYIFIKLINAI